MVKINDKEFKIYDLDSIDTILNRIASNMVTLREYLYFPGKSKIPTIDELKSDANTNVIDLFHIIINSTDFSELFSFIEDKLDQQKLSIKKVIEIFIAYNTSIAEAYNKADISYGITTTNYYLSIIQATVDAVLTERIDYVSIRDSRKQIYSFYQNKIKTNISNVANQINDFEAFTLLNGIPFTKFELESVYIEVELTLKNMTPLEIFNKLKLTNSVPFASCMDFFKVRKEISPISKWNTFNPSVILKILHTEQTTYRETDYNDIIIETPVKDTNIKGLLEYPVANSIPQKILINRFLNVLDLEDTDVVSTKEKEIKGVFYFPGQSMNRYIMTDMILNDPEFSEFLSLDETVISTKQTILVNFYSVTTGYVSAYLTSKVGDKKDPVIKVIKEIKDNENYVRVKVSKALNEKSVKSFQDSLSKLFNLYNQRFQRIFDIYRIYIPEVLLVVAPKKNPSRKRKGKKNILNETASDVFVANYTSFCGRPPTMIRDEEAVIEIANGREVLTFPKNDEEGSIPRKYICNYKNFPYPGLRDNTLSNSDKFRYLPCCYTSPQTEKNIYKNYYRGEPLVETETDRYIIKTNKFVGANQFGVLPYNISKFFKLIDNTEDYQYFRKGVSRTKNSFLNCVLEALKKIDTEPRKDLDLELQNIRKSFSNEELAASCKQEMYQYNIIDILEKINDLDEYFSPDSFIHLIEVYYDCNIMLFKRDIETPDGTLYIPTHEKCYLKNKLPFKSCIFIYEHEGNTSDNATYPQCELICRWNPKGKMNEIDYSFPSESTITKKAFKVFEDLIVFNELTHQISFIDFPLGLKIESQSIDYYGKTRLLNVNYAAQVVTIITSPLQPFAVREEVEIKINKVSEVVAREFMKSIGVNSVDIVDNIIKGKINNVDISIPLLGSKLTNYSEYNSDIHSYNYFKRLARYVTQYFYWLYSKYLKDNKVTQITSDLQNNFDDFKKNNITIDPSFVYGNVNKDLSLTNGLMKDSKLVLKNSTSLDRLFYLLKIEFIRDPKNILAYYTRIMIENYYLDITDFETYPSQIILEGTDSVNKLINSIDNNYYTIFDTIQKTTTKPYFFKNKLVDDKLYLAQNTISIESAMQVYINWKMLKFNSLFETAASEVLYRFYFYAYKNNTTVKKYIVPGENEPQGVGLIKILGFILTKDDVEEQYSTEPDFEEKSFYTALLPLD